MVTRDVCPRCQSPHYQKNGRIHNGKQNHQCKACGRQFVDCCEQYLVAEDTRALIERLLVERISLRGICRAVGVTLKWLVGFLVQCGEALPDHLNVQPVSRTQDVVMQRLEVEADEMQSLVEKKGNKQWSQGLRHRVAESLWPLDSTTTAPSPRCVYLTKGELGSVSSNNPRPCSTVARTRS
jgi:hypothetical protein